ncbi:MAG: hypothetical protein EXX96DRAFT_563070 [Benjaminiella poitrasii]|nr:MAG: hypothetical protein EXX96DRAFT_563070 [Benjaminiella poitrasii]
MYNNNPNVPHSDPYAGQYPPPPPLTTPVATEDDPITTYPRHDHAAYSVAMPQIPQDVYTPISPPPIAPPANNNYFSSYTIDPQSQPYAHHQDYSHHQDVVQPYHHPQDSQLYGHQPSPLHDPPSQQTDSLENYLKQEREEYLKHDTHPHYHSNQAPPPPPLQPLQQQYHNNSSSYTTKLTDEFETEQLEEEKTPMVHAKPYRIAKPAPPPENEEESYRYRPTYDDTRHSGGCNCCCYNPAITCCSFFWLLVSCAFLAAGIALIIASKVITAKCNNTCTDLSACGTICDKVVHDGMFYGGIVVAGLAAIAVLWKLIMWTCAGYSKR